jgi:BirA family transcriptional regulator, biotin operon repressor / biotin---[acetyl-CoA-carboxylase] ligase
VSAEAPDRSSAASTGLGRPRVHLRRTDSTNERARVLALAGAPHGMLVTAAEQTAGRGRQGRRWSAPPGSSLLMSLVLRHPAPLLPLIAAVAVCDVVGERALVKWPNDIVLAAADVADADEDAGHPLGETALSKLAGILIEGRPQEGWVVLGIGVNVAVDPHELPRELRAGSAGSAGERAPMPAASLGGSAADVEPLLGRLLDALSRRLAEPAESTLEAWRARDALHGREIAWSAGHGRAQGVDERGRLVVALDDGEHTALSAGEVHLEEIS